MAKGKLIIEFDDAADLRRQLQMLMYGAEWMGKAAPTPPAPLVPLTPEQQDINPSSPRGVLGIVGMDMQAERTAPAEPVPEAPKAPEPAKEPEKPAEKPAEASPTPPAAGDQVALTLETLGTAPYDDLLKFCEQNKVVGVDVEKNRQPFFRKLVEMRIRTHLETAAH